MRKILTLAFTFLILASSVYAQPKPIGVYDATHNCQSLPQYVSFSTIADYDIEGMYQAAACSRLTGKRWILQAGFGDPIGHTVQAQKAKDAADRAGLTPYIAGITYREELSGMLERGEIPLPFTIQSIDLITQFAGEQQRILKATWNVPVLYVDTFINQSPQYGPHWYHPIPPNTDAIGFEAYVPRGETWENSAGLLFNYSLAQTNLPFVIIGQAFQTYAENDIWNAGPTENTIDNTVQLLNNPRVVSLLLFTWNSRLNMKGLKDLPRIKRLYEDKLHVRD